MDKVLYLGIDPKNWHHLGDVFHYPLIQTQLVEIDSLEPFFNKIKKLIYSHILFTSQSTVKYFFECANCFKIDLKRLNNLSAIIIGKVTNEALNGLDFKRKLIATNATSEGICDLLRNNFNLIENLFYPHSRIARDVIKVSLDHLKISYDNCILYDTYSYHNKPLPNLNDFSKIVFTSPSTVKSFLEIWPSIPWEKEIIAIGPITKSALEKSR